MAISSIYSNILNEHNLRPSHRGSTEGATQVLEGVNPSCGDDIFLELRLEEGVIKDASFNGSGCAISQASADMMLDLIVGETKEQALHLIDIFMRMIRGEASEDEIDELDEAGLLKDISHMPARVKCAVLSWRTLKEMLEKED
ncbi:MAG: SUF system NifU family Fe-S cluster assembly protein [Lachnospiraceae bacterium]|nr:SUF system NifU family Fe-S cluster assembly protein [Lachnospiraceae bacterium]